MRQAVHILGAVLLGSGVLGLAWALTVWQWQDPFTALYATYQQHRLTQAYEKRFASYVVPEPSRPIVHPKNAALSRKEARAEQRAIGAAAKNYQRTLKTGDALGRIRVPRLGLSIVVVTGTDTASLEKGPGWYTGTYLPGEGQLIYIAGHRTTYLAPFAHIDSMRPGDRVRLELPYATFVYRVSSHVIVPADDIGRLKSHGHEVIALQACHPRFFATQRYIVYAKPVRVLPRRGTPYLVGANGLATGLAG